MTRRPVLLAIAFAAVLATVGACAGPAPTTALGRTGGASAVANARATAPTDAPHPTPTRSPAAGHGSPGAPSHGSPASSAPASAPGAGAVPGAGAAGRLPSDFPSVDATAVYSSPPENYSLAYAEDPQMICAWQYIDDSQFFLYFYVMLQHTGGNSLLNVKPVRATVTIDGYTAAYPMLVPGLNKVYGVAYPNAKYRTVTFGITLLVQDTNTYDNHAAASIQIPSGGPVKDVNARPRLTCFPTY